MMYGARLSGGDNNVILDKDQYKMSKLPFFLPIPPYSRRRMDKAKIVKVINHPLTNKPWDWASFL